MSDFEVIRRVRAYGAGRPLPRGRTLHFLAPAKDDLRIAFVRMGGESAPWGVGWMDGDAKANFLTVPEARDRDLVAGMMESFAPVLCRHLSHPAFGPAPVRRSCLWLPGPSHLEMLHHIAIAYQNVQKAPEPRLSSLRALGRAATWLFREAHRPGQVDVTDASAGLRESFSFPADDIRQQHLGFLLAWISKGTRDERLQRAQEAERRSVATTLDPVRERDELEPLLERIRTSSGKALASASSAIDSILRSELQARLELVEAAREVLAKDTRPVNPGLVPLRTNSDRAWQKYLQMEGDIAAGKKAWVPGPLADHGPVAPSWAMRWTEAYQEVAELSLTHHDTDLQAEWVASGEAVSGTIRSITSVVIGGKTRPRWTVDSPGHGPLKMRPESKVVVAGEEGRVGVVREIADAPGGRRLTVDITAWMKGPKVPRPDVLPAGDARQLGRRVVLLEHGPDPISMLFNSHFGERDGPGAWLTRKVSKKPTADEVEQAS